MHQSSIILTLLAANSALCMTVTSPTNISKVKNSTLDWSACPSPFPSHFQCTKIDAPLHYDQPQSRTIALNMVNIPAKDQSKRIGYLIFQEGGPGDVTSLDIIEYDNGVGWQKLQQYFDILVVDPRGVGLNFPVKCDPKLAAKAPRRPQSEEDWERALNFYEQYGNDCKRRTGEDIWPTLDTGTAARDLETVRIALGDGGINYYGLSWGSQRGQQYVELFPNNIRTFILDGVVDHKSSVEVVGMSSATNVALTMNNFYRWAATNRSSALYGQDGAATSFNELVFKLDVSPVTVAECATSKTCSPIVSGDSLRSVTSSWLTNTGNYPTMARQIAYAFQGNFTGWTSPVSTTEISQTNSFAAIGCNDWQTNQTYAEYANRERAYKALSGTTFDGSIAMRDWMLYCPRWPTKVVNPPRPLAIAKTSAPVLPVNALRDPATGYDGAVNIQRQIPGSVLLTRHGDGHGSMSPFRSGAAQDYMFQYAITKQPCYGMPSIQERRLGLRVDQLHSTRV